MTPPAHLVLIPSYNPGDGTPLRSLVYDSEGYLLSRQDVLALLDPTSSKET